MDAIRAEPTSPPATERSRRTGRIGLARILTTLAILAAPAAMAVIIGRSAVNAPFNDEWDTLAIVPKAFDGSLRFADVLAQQNEHRMVIVNLISLLNAKTTHLNLVVEMYLGFGLQVLSLLLIWNLLANTLKDRYRGLIGPLAIAASLLLFWPVMYEIWTWALTSIQYLSSVFWAVVVVWALARWPGSWNAVAIVSVAMVVAILTSGQGFVLIPVGIIGIAAYGLIDRRIRWDHICAFGLVSLAVTVVYTRNLTFPAYPPDPLAHAPVLMIGYVLTYLGSPFWTAKAHLSLSLGLLGLGVIAAESYYILAHFRSRIRSELPWLLLACYSVIAAIITAWGRTRFGVDQATAPRYREIVIPFWIAILATSVIIAVHLAPRFSAATVRAALTFALIIFLGGYSYLYFRGFQWMRAHDSGLSHALPDLLNYDRVPDSKLEVFHPAVEKVRKLAPLLRQYQLSQFAGRPVPSGPNSAN